MKYQLRFRPEVPEDLAASANWYDDRQVGLGNQFLAAFQVALEQLQFAPVSRAADSLGLRSQRLKRFPFRIFYKLTGDMLIVIAVWHARRDSDQLSQRS